jgi:hypothetical protein
MMAMKRGSVDATALFEFAPNAENPKFDNWYSEKPVSEWEGVVSSNSKDQILEIDFAKIDPLLQVRHRLPNLAVMRFPAFKPDTDKGEGKGKGKGSTPASYIPPSLSSGIYTVPYGMGYGKGKGKGKGKSGDRNRSGDREKAIATLTPAYVKQVSLKMRFFCFGPALFPSESI